MSIEPMKSGVTYAGVIMIVFLSVSHGSAPVWLPSFDELAKRADVVVIGIPVSTIRTENTDEYLVGHVEQLRTRVRIGAVLKGQAIVNKAPPPDSLYIIHFRNKVEGGISNWSGLEFGDLIEDDDPQEAKNKKHVSTYLLFLKIRPDGDFQTIGEPSDASNVVFRISNLNGEIPKNPLTVPPLPGSSFDNKK